MNPSLLNDRRLQILLGVTFACITGVSLHDPVPQWESYHHFADTRAAFGIPNAWNVLSNLPFLFVGIWGFLKLWKSKITTRTQDLCFAVGVILTCFGSAYYHWAPDNARLVWDRLPMTLAFMSLLSALVTDHIEVKLGQRLLIPLLLLGVASVWYWRWSELAGHGDLRPYGLVQFYPVVGIPLILWLFPKKNAALGYLLWAVAAYVLAKVLEFRDAQLFGL